MELRLAGISPESIVDGPGLRMTLFAQGCGRGCLNCHNPQTHDENGGKLYELNYIIKKISENPLLDGVTFSGGEPMLQAEAFAELAEALPDNLGIYCYTGYLFEELIEMNDKNINKLLSLIDVLVDGPYEEDKRSLELRFKGSANQRALDSKESLRQKKAVIFKAQEVKETLI